jgi:uncharacterized protein (AIM24 family)/predicted negative regulator of RcsB-dependent stress response
MAESEKSKEEEFYYLLTEGSEHLQAGRIDEARQHFEKALLLNPTNEQGLNLLGLSLFRLGQLDRARQIFNDLVYNNPIEPSLRLNLAMVYLKQGKLEDAHTELERVLELNPDHPRAASYMGLVLEKKGQLERAADFYERAGNKKRADEIRAFRPTQTGTFPIPNLAALGIANAPATAAPGPAAMRAASATAPTPSTPPTAAPVANVAVAAARPTTTMTMQAVSLTPQASVAPTSTSTMPAPARPTTPPTPAAPAPPAPTASTSSQKQTEAAALTALTSAQVNKGPEPPPARVESSRNMFALDQPPTAPTATAATTTPAASPTAITDLPLTDLASRALSGAALVRTADGQLVMPIHEVSYVRTDLLASVSGSFEIEVVNRRYRGKRTDSLFGGADAAVVALMGKGFCVVTLGDLVPTTLTLASEEVYLVETGVVGFTAGLVWENGRLPSEADRDLDIVHLRGSGRVVLGSKKPIIAVTVKADAPVMVHATRLVGWTGQLVPYRAPLPGLPEPARRVPVVRFEGTGTVLTL